MDQAYELVLEAPFMEKEQFEKRINDNRAAVFEGWCPRRQFTLPHDEMTDFVVVYSVLNYLYTKKIGFYRAYHLPGHILDMKVLDVWDEKKVMTLYSLADYWEILELRDDLLLWFRLTCTPKNIDFRITQDFATQYVEVHETYLTFLRDNWAEMERFHKNNIGIDEKWLRELRQLMQNT